MIHNMDYIMERVVIDDATGCWEWQRSTSDGYGQFGIQESGTSHRAHRFVWELTHGPVKEGLVVRHKCFNRLCCNPEHLCVGTIAENNQDSAHLHTAAAKRRRGRLPSNAKECTIDGITYKSIDHARKALGISWREARNKMAP